MRAKIVVAVIISTVLCGRLFAQCQPPTVDPIPTPVTNYGAGVTLTAYAHTNDNSYLFQWYTGSAGDVSSPVANGTSNQITVNPAVTTNYWMRFSNSCASVSTNTVQVVRQECPYPPPSAEITVPPIVCKFQVVQASVPRSPDPSATYTWALYDHWPVPPGNQPSYIIDGTGPTATFVAWKNPSMLTGRGILEIEAIVKTACGYTARSIVGFITDTTPANSTITSAYTVQSGHSYTATQQRKAPLYSDYSLLWSITNGTITGGQGTTSITYTAGNGPVTLNLTETNACGSNSASLTVQPCGPIVIDPQPKDFFITAGTSVNIGGPRAFENGFSDNIHQLWFAQIPGGSPFGISCCTLKPGVTTNYWVVFSHEDCAVTAESRHATVYVCDQARSFSVQPADATITTGQQTTLFAAASGAGDPFTYQWYLGSGGDTTHPAGSGSSITVSPTTTSTYWVRATNGCGIADSRAATVTVAPPPPNCVPPVMTVEPSDVTITAGQSTQLSVSASGGGSVSYQWYTGTAGDASHPAGTGPTLTVSPTTTTQYWARATSCASVNSRTATVIVNPLPPSCVPPTVTLEPADVAVAPGAKATLFVGYTGTTPLIQWFKGAAGDTSHPIDGANAQTLTIDPAVSGSYWVRLTNSCGGVNSRTATVTVNVPPLPARHRSARH